MYTVQCTLFYKQGKRKNKRLSTKDKPPLSLYQDGKALAPDHTKDPALSRPNIKTEKNKKKTWPQHRNKVSQVNHFPCPFPCKPLHQRTS